MRKYNKDFENELKDFRENPDLYKEEENENELDDDIEEDEGK